MGAIAESELAIVGATVIDGTGATPLENGVVLIRGDRIVAVESACDTAIPAGAHKIDGRGMYLIPGLLDAVNSRWFNTNLETLVRYEGRYHELFLEAAQLALKGGVTGMFATWRSHSAVRTARDLIRSG